MTKKYGKHTSDTSIDIQFENQYGKFVLNIPFSGDRRKFSGVYKITNIANGKVYIGSSLHIRSRWKEHFNKLCLGKHHSSHLQRAWDLYGAENFIFEILEYVEPNKSLLKKHEQEWMNKLQSYNKEFGYNIRKKAASPAGSLKRKSIWNKGKKLVPDTFRKCLVCGAKFKLSYSTDPKIICNNKCKGISKRKLVDLVCPVCKGHFQRRPSEIDTYCSRECYYTTYFGNKYAVK